MDFRADGVGGERKGGFSKALRVGGYPVVHVKLHAFSVLDVVERSSVFELWVSKDIAFSNNVHDAATICAVQVSNNFES